MQQFITLGQMSPIKDATGRYLVEFEACWTALPTDRSANLTLAFGHADDTYYEHQYGKSTGYHGILRADGTLALYSHETGNTSGTQLGTDVATPAPKAGQWMRFELTVTLTNITWSRLDAAAPCRSTTAPSMGRRDAVSSLRTRWPCTARCPQS